MWPRLRHGVERARVGDGIAVADGSLAASLAWRGLGAWRGNPAQSGLKAVGQSRK